MLPLSRAPVPDRGPERRARPIPNSRRVYGSVLPAFTRAIRTAIAATASVLIARLVQMPEAYWAAIATLVVMQSALGATLTLSIERIVATAVGASVGALEANFSAQTSLRSRLQSFSLDCSRSHFVWRRLRIATPALPSPSSF